MSGRSGVSEQRAARRDSENTVRELSGYYGVKHGWILARDKWANKPTAMCNEPVGAACSVYTM